MQAAIVENGVIANIIEVESLDFMPGLVEVTNENIGWVWNGSSFAPAPIPPEQIQDEIVASTQQRLDSFAKTRNYDSILSACTYATDTNAKFASEGQYCVEARSATWTKLLEMLAEVEAETRPMPTGYADIEGELPVLAWPTQTEM
jgi:hypothetical protein